MSVDLDSEIIKLYKQNKSTHEIAKMLSTNPTRIRRTLIKHGVKIRNRSEAQKAAISTGRVKHPTEGKVRTQKERENISSGLENSWNSISKKEKDRRAQVSKDRWDNMPMSKKANILELAIKGVRKAGKEGSKFENLIKDRLTRAGYRVEAHKTNLIANEKLEIDLYLPDLKTIIEIDGPSHFLPIWGEEKLQKQIRADLDKNGLILSKGFVILRVKVLSKQSLKKQEDTIRFLTTKLEEIKSQFPQKSHRYIEVE